jgi:putative membrane protein
MKNAFLTFLLVVSIALIFPQAGRGQQKEHGGTTQDSFLNKAMEMNQAEINLSRTAQEKAQDPKVKEYAGMMIQDHTKALEELRNEAGASSGEVTLTKQHQRTSDRLSRLSGTEFDKAYMDAMVRDHQQAVQTFQREADGSSGNTTRQKPGTSRKSDADIAREMLPTLQKHLSQAEQIDRSIGGSAGTK